VIKLYYQNTVQYSFAQCFTSFNRLGVCVFKEIIKNLDKVLAEIKQVADIRLLVLNKERGFDLQLGNIDLVKNLNNRVSTFGESQSPL